MECSLLSLICELENLFQSDGIISLPEVELVFDGLP
ncbi:MAG: hypothetical protein UY90_C0059G0004 [Candidatus Peregrinibacteria bacterium GW2011_GWA2_54_9]|nr:MAG: hypothetical protein UY90_C0059G0004 [Candidatus Peregrinibacteria bacterium GW2011_GWA2_54_9]